MLRVLITCSIVALAATVSSCTVGRQPAVEVHGANAVFTSANNHEAVWERVVDVLHDYQFQIARQNKLDGVIETEYKTGSSLLEPWHLDSVGFENRLESTLQSMRRRVFVRIIRPPEAVSGFQISVEAHKELEDLVGVAANSPGGATFQDNSPLERNLEVVVGQSTPSGWIFAGRDVLLEQDILRRIQTILSK